MQVSENDSQVPPGEPTETVAPTSAPTPKPTATPKPTPTPTVDPIIAIAGKKPENSDWDGSVDAVKKWFKDNLPDPGSNKDEKWYVVVPATGSDGKPAWGVRVQFRTKNQYGAYELLNMYFKMRNGEVIEFGQ